MPKRCAYGLCKSDTRYPKSLDGEVEFFPFPKPKTQGEKCRAWIKQCGRPHSQLNVDRINKNTYICSKHFVNRRPTPEYPNPIAALPVLGLRSEHQGACRRCPRKRKPAPETQHEATTSNSTEDTFHSTSQQSETACDPLTAMSKTTSREYLGSDHGDPAQRRSQQPERVKVEDCSQTLELNVIVKEEEGGMVGVVGQMEWKTRELKEEEMQIENAHEVIVDRMVKREGEVMEFKEEVEERAITEEVEESTIKEEETEVKVEFEERSVKEDCDERPGIDEEDVEGNREMTTPDLEEMDGVTDPEHHIPRRTPARGRPSVDHPLRLTARHFPALIPQTDKQGSRTRRHCRVCLFGSKKQRKMTKFMCVPCDTPLCVTPCFEEYHTLEHY